MVDPEEVHQRGLHVVDMDPVLGDVPAEVVGRPMDVTWLHAAAGEPPRVGAAEVVAALEALARLVLGERRAAELAAPDDEGVVEESALLEVLDERRAGLVGVEALLGELAGGKIIMLIPAGVHELREAHAALGEAAGDEAVIRESAGLEDVGAIHLEHRLGLVLEVEQVGHRGLHAEGHLVLRDARVDRRVAGFAEVGAVERLHVVEHRATRLAADAGGIIDVRDRVADAAEAHALMLAGQEAVGPVVFEEQLAAGLGGVGGRHHDIRRQVFVHRTEAVGQPGAHRRTAGDLRAGHEERHAGRVVDRLGVHRADDADLVRDRAQVRQHLAQFDPAGTPLLEGLERRRRDVFRVAARHRGEAGVAAHAGGDVLAGHLGEQRFMIEEVDVRRASALPEADHALGLGGEVRQARQTANGLVRGLGIAGEEGPESDGADALDAGTQEATASQALAPFRGRKFEVHGISRG